MQSRLVINLALLVLVLVLAMLAITHNQDQEQAGAPPGDLLPDLAAQDVRRIGIQVPGGTPCVLEKRQANWMMSAPVAVRANQYLLERLAKLADAPIERAFPLADKDPGTYGLGPAAINLRFNDTAIGLGAQHPMKSLRYARRLDEIALITEDIYQLLQGSPASLISNELFEPGASILSIELPTMRLQREGLRWRTEPPVAQEITADAYQRFLDAWRYAQALYVSLATAAPDSASKPVKIRFGLADQRTVEFVLLKRQQETLLWRAELGIYYHMHAEQLKTMLQFPPHES